MTYGAENLGKLYRWLRLRAETLPGAPSELRCSAARRGDDSPWRPGRCPLAVPGSTQRRLTGLPALKSVARRVRRGGMLLLLVAGATVPVGGLSSNGVFGAAERSGSSCRAR